MNNAQNLINNQREELLLFIQEQLSFYKSLTVNDIKDLPFGILRSAAASLAVLTLSVDKSQKD